MSSLRPALASDRDLAKIRAAKETVHPALAVLRAGHFLTKHQWYLSSAPNITDNARSGPLALAFRPLSPPALPQWTPSSELVLTRDGEGQWGWHVAPGMRFWSIEPSAPAFVAFGDPEIGARLITLILEDADTVMDEGDEARASALREVARRLGIACAELKARGGAAAKSTAGKATARKTTARKATARKTTRR